MTRHMEVDYLAHSIQVAISLKRASLTTKPQALTEPASSMKKDRPGHRQGPLIESATPAIKHVILSAPIHAVGWKQYASASLRERLRTASAERLPHCSAERLPHCKCYLSCASQSITVRFKKMRGRPGVVGSRWISVTFCRRPLDRAHSWSALGASHRLKSSQQPHGTNPSQRC